MKNRRELTLEEYVRRKSAGLSSKYEVLRDVYDGVRKGRLKIRDPDPPKDFLEYLVRLDYSLWVWVTIAMVCLTLLSIATSDFIPTIIYLRYVLGSVFVLFIPGYVTIEALYPRESELSPLERLALSIGLSLAIIPLIGLILNYTPWGIRLVPILTSITLYTLVIVMVAAYRKYKLVKQLLSPLRG